MGHLRVSVVLKLCGFFSFSVFGSFFLLFGPLYHLLGEGFFFWAGMVWVGCMCGVVSEEA